MHALVVSGPDARCAIREQRRMVPSIVVGHVPAVIAARVRLVRQRTRRKTLPFRVRARRRHHESGRRGVLPVSDVDAQQLARSGATAVHLFLAWCERRGVRLIDPKRGHLSSLVTGEIERAMLLEGSDLDKLIAEWGREQFGAKSPLLAATKAPTIDVELVDEIVIQEKGTRKDVETIDAVATAALARVSATPSPMVVREGPGGELVVSPTKNEAIAVPTTAAGPPPGAGRPCPNCRGSGQVPGSMMGKMLALECPSCHGTGYAPKPAVRGTACSCTSRAINPICAVHGAECICPTPYLQDPNCPLHRRVR